jgi:hypothetical protein
LKTLLLLAAGKSESHNSVPSVVRNRSELNRLLTDLCPGTKSSGDILLNTVTAHQTPLEILQGTKEMSKTLMADAATEAHRSAATLLYHAAVAAALARFNVNISSVSPESRVSLYEDLASALGADPLGDVFRMAAARLMEVGESP